MSGFLGTFNRLSGAGSGPAMDADQVQRVVLQALRERPSDLKELGELSVPMSAVAQAVERLHGMGLVETVADSHDTYRLSDYAAKALTYLTPS